jgi:hypothetical protein
MGQGVVSERIMRAKLNRCLPHPHWKKRNQRSEKEEPGEALGRVG